MTIEHPSKRPLTQLNHEIEQAEAEAARLEGERKEVTKDASRSLRRLRYYRFAQWLRRPRASLELWPMLVMLFGPLVVGILAMIVVHFPTNSYPLAFFAFLVGTVAGVGVFASLIYHPADTLLPAAISEAEAQSRLSNARLEEKLSRVAEAKQKIERLLEERRDQIASGKLQKAALLQRNWKSMRGPEWEDFVVEVLRTLGAKVERMGSREASGASNLVADFGSRRVAILTDAEEHNIASSTIQTAIATKDRQGCQSCAVIVNRRFTGAAQDFAQRHGCAAIGSSEFPDFVLGKIEV